MAFGRYQSFTKKQPGTVVDRALYVVLKVAAQYTLDSFWVGQYYRSISERQWQFAARSIMLRQRFEGTEDAMADKRRDATKQRQPTWSGKRSGGHSTVPENTTTKNDHLTLIVMTRQLHRLPSDHGSKRTWAPCGSARASRGRRG